MERAEQTVEVLGLDHVYLTVADLACSERFYDGVMRLLGFRKGDKAIAGAPHAHYLNRVMQVTLRPAARAVPHDPYAPGLHHLCFQVPAPADVDAAARGLGALGVDATPPRRYPEYNPDYYATFFSDPDGLRLEVVARTPYRDALVRHWDAFTVFLNPLAELQARAAAAPGTESTAAGGERNAAHARAPGRVTIRDADLTDAAHGASLVAILDSYARGAGGQGAPLDGEVRRNLVRGLAAHPSAFALLAFDDDRAVGAAVCVWTYSTFAARPALNVHDLAVLPEDQGRGIGRALLAEIEVRARARGCCKLTLEVHDTNERAKRLYRRTGFGPWDAATLFVTKPLADGRLHSAVPRAGRGSAT